MNEVTWFGQVVDFYADYEEIELQKISYDIILVTSLPLRHWKNVTKITSQNFSILGPPIKISGYASAQDQSPVLSKVQYGKFGPVAIV